MQKKIIGFEEIVAGCKKNNNNCKELIYKTYYGYLMGVVIRYVRDEDDAQELVNDSFIKIFKNIAQFDWPEKPEEHQASFKSWIAKITSRTAIDHLRTKKGHIYVSELAEEYHPVENINVIAELNLKDILNLLKQLPETHCLVFNMYEIEGFSHYEIAQLLKITESASRVYLTRAKNKLRELYSKTIISSYEIY